MKSSMHAILILLLVMVASADQQPSDPGKPEAAADTKQPESTPPVVIPNLPPKEKLTPLEEKLDAPLRGLMRAAKSGGSSAAKKAAVEQAIPLDKDRVAVRLVAKSRRDLGALKRRLLRLGGTYTTTFHESLYGKLPLHKIETMASEPAVVKLTADLPISHPLHQADPNIPGKK